MVSYIPLETDLAISCRLQPCARMQGDSNWGQLGWVKTSIDCAEIEDLTKAQRQNLKT